MNDIPVAYINYDHGSGQTPPPVPRLGWFDRDNPLAGIAELAFKDAQDTHGEGVILSIAPGAVNEFTIHVPADAQDPGDQAFDKVIEVKSDPNWGGDVYFYDDDWSLHVTFPDNFKAEMMKKLGQEVPE